MIGKTLAQYEITAPLGKGGMGEVYRARDTKLGREVALKVLPKEMSGDPEREARFDREARALASLQHANVASLYGFENVEGVQFLVMELVEGQNLQQRLMEGAPPQDEVLRIARQMAAGLEAAHDKGIVHRDLKPANVMLTPDGDVKILDFGLARAWFGDSVEDGDVTASPTITAAMTQAGTILGTAAYMSPEQARGKNVDRRADIWAFGVILWEMLTGRRLFEGETVSDTLAAVIRAEPEWELLPADEHPVLCRLIERCLTRDPRQRLRDIGEARIVLEDPSASGAHLSMLGAPAAPADEAAPAKLAVLPMLIIALLFSAVGAGIGWKLLATTPEPPLYHVMIPAPAEMDFDLGSSSPGPAVLSPDGSMLAFTLREGDASPMLYLRRLDEAEAVELSGTEGAAYPFWSPDSQFIGFFSGDGKLKKVSIVGSSPITLCPAGNGKGGSWNEEGTIIFAAEAGVGLSKVSSLGGDPVTVTELRGDANSHRHPRFLPDGRRFLVLARENASADGMHSIQLGSLDGDSLRVLTRSQTQAEYSAGHLLTVREDVLLATPFDAAKGSFTGGATPLVEDILVISAGAAHAVYSTTLDGNLSYQTGITTSNRVLEWRELGSENTTSLATRGQIHRPRVSPDGRSALIEVSGESQEGIDLWMVDLETGLRTRFTFDAGNETFPVWSPNGQSVVYCSTISEPEPQSRILQQAVDGAGTAAILYESEFALRATSVTPDGKFLYFDRTVEGKYDMMRLPLDGNGEIEEILATPVSEGGAVVSPNGKWLAYHADSASTWDIFVASIDGGRRKWQVTTYGAVWPQWSPDGSMLLASGFGGGITAFEVDGGGESFRIGASRVVAETDVPGSEGCVYSIHPDGSRILHTLPDPEATGEISLLHFVTDWRRGLAR